jgi:hypothetical protein
LKESKAVRALTHPVTVAFGLANLYLLALTGPLISPDHDLVYHLTGSAVTIVVPVIVYVVVLTILFAVLLRIAEQYKRLWEIVWAAAVLALLPILLETFAGFFSIAVPGWISLVVGVVCLGSFAAIALQWRPMLRVFERLQPILATILGFISLCGVWIFVQLLWCGWQARDLNPAPTLHHAQLVEGPPRQRIVWILLDELSYQQVYERRFLGLQLPAFDQLAAQSAVFTDVNPVGKFTSYILPSLFTGIPSDRVHVSAAGLLVSMHDTASKRWVRFQQHGTVFQDAIDAGYSTGVAGWYNPYCRTLPAVLDHCYWMYHETTPAGFSSDSSISANLLLPFRLALLDVRHFFGGGPGSPSDELLDIQMHTADYRELLAAGDSLLSDPSVDFVFLHMPVPHPYGFYDRKSESFATRHTSYIDNLALADRYLAHVRQLLEREHEWDSTAVVVMGDHSWRTSFVWENSPGWTAEDEAASHGGQFDSRPAYIVKLPNQQVGERIDVSFAAVRTRALFDALLQNRVRTPEELRQWVGQ